jgi:hypothetical protein
MLFLNKDPADASLKWSELLIQAFIVSMARKDGYTVHGDQNGSSKTVRGRMESSLSALAGWPDLCFILPDGPLWIELKYKTKKKPAKRSQEQIDLHELMEKAGCRIYTVYAESPMDGWLKVLGIVSPYKNK